MDEETRLIIGETFPNFPEALAEEWLAPYVQELGAPQSSGRWLNILAGHPIEFWRNVCWAFERINLVDAMSGLSSASNRTLVEMERAYFQGMPTPYSEITDGKERTLQALEFLKEHRVFPCPPTFLRGPHERIDIIDGNHRMLAFVLAMRQAPPTADAIQEVWVARAPEASFGSGYA